MSNQRDLALAYSPGVAVPCLEIQKDPLKAYEYTAKGNLVAVISNGTAVLGLGNIGAVAGKPVMEGKGCLFKKFAGIDVFDIEIDETDPDRLVDSIASLEPTFGGINLEDIKAPECFEIETKLRARMKIPVFHDDQHGTAIVAAAALLNALHVVEKPIGEVKLVCSGAGRRGHRLPQHRRGLGVRRENVWVTDSKGVVFKGRGEAMDEQKAQYAQATDAAHAGRGHRRCRRVLRALGRGRAQARDGGTDGAAADHPGDGKPRSRDPARAGEGGAPGLHHRHRTQRLSQPGQQRAVLSRSFSGARWTSARPRSTRR